VSKYAEVREDLRRRIAAGEFDRGTLPELSYLKHEYGVALNTVRRAEHDLADEGILEIAHGRPTRILQRPQADADAELLKTLRGAHRAIGTAISALTRRQALREDEARP
jgi:DNA-binding GntR family transcriptional regulator